MLKKGLYSGFALIIINKHLYIFHDKYRVTHHHYTIHTDTEVYISQSTFTYFVPIESFQNSNLASQRKYPKFDAMGTI